MEEFEAAAATPVAFPKETPSSPFDVASGGAHPD